MIKNNIVYCRLPFVGRLSSVPMHRSDQHLLVAHKHPFIGILFSLVFSLSSACGKPNSNIIVTENEKTKLEESTCYARSFGRSLYNAHHTRTTADIAVQFICSIQTGISFSVAVSIYNVKCKCSCCYAAGFFLCLLCCIFEFHSYKNYSMNLHSRYVDIFVRSATDFRHYLNDSERKMNHRNQIDTGFLYVQTLIQYDDVNNHLNQLSHTIFSVSIHNSLFCNICSSFVDRTGWLHLFSIHIITV